MLVEALHAVTRSGGVDPEGLPAPPLPQRGDDHGVAALHPFNPAQIEAALRDRDRHHARDVWAPLGPVEAESAEAAAGQRTVGSLIPNSVSPRVPAVVISAISSSSTIYSMSDERIGEIDAEAARKVVVAHPGRTERACLKG